MYGATSGLLQNDLKRIIAMSTISQLGYMFMAIGLSQYNVALFHTVNHAFFKALLFLGAGAVIHSFNDQQDVRKMGGLIKFMPFVYSVMLVGTLSLMALPFLTGFFSKDLILELAYTKYSFSGLYAYILGSLTAGITAFYSFRLISLVFLQGANGQKQSYLNAHESNWYVIIPLLTLSICSIFFGYVMSDLFVGVGSDFFQNSLLILPENINLIEAELLSTDSYIKYPNVDSVYKDLNFNLKTDNSNLIIKLLPTLLSVFGALLGLLLYNNKHYLKLLTPYLFNKPYSILNNIDNTNIKSTQTSPLLANYTTTHIKAPSTLLPEGTIGTHPIVDIYSVTKNNNLLKKLYSFFNGKYYFDIIYNNFIIAKGMNFSYKISKEIDRGIVELLGPNGLSNVFYNLAKNIARLDSGIITTYALYITISLLVFIFLFFVTPSYPALNAELLGSEILSQDKVEYIINSYNINIENIDKNIFNAGNISNSHLSDIKEKGFMNALKFQNSIEVFKFIIILIFCLFLLPNLNKNKKIN